MFRLLTILNNQNRPFFKRLLRFYSGSNATNKLIYMRRFSVFGEIGSMDLLKYFHRLMELSFSQSAPSGIHVSFLLRGVESK